MVRITNHGGPEQTEEQRVQQIVQEMYARQTRERKVFLDDLTEYRKKKNKRMFETMRDNIGPRWYQALSEPQRAALDKLKPAIYQDLLEGLPKRSAVIMRHLGLFPRPSNSDLMTCCYAGNDDPKEMIAQLYLMTYGYPINAKQATYCLNARLMLSAILYLGLDDLIRLLRERFKADAQPKPKEKPKKEKKPPKKSPYLERQIAIVHLSPKFPRHKPKPLPNLDDLNEPYEEIPIMPKPPPPPPPPPPPKKRLPIAMCDKLAGMNVIEAYQSDDNLDNLPRVRSTKRSKRSARSTTGSTGKKKYGIGAGIKKTKRMKKPKSPKTAYDNAQYTINGVSVVKGRAVFTLGNVCILPPQGDLIHGGFSNALGLYINVHCGFRGRPPPSKSGHCDCLKKWQDTAFQHVKENKCLCGHNFDYGNDGEFPKENVPFFEKPTPHVPMQFNYHSIFDLDPASQAIEKKFKEVWDKDSLLDVRDEDIGKKERKLKKKRTSKTCLGQKPKLEDYLKCALRFMRNVNTAARLPDLHLVPELIEWMRYRIHGPMTRSEKAEYLRKSSTYWAMLDVLAIRGFGHVNPPKDPRFSGHLTTWTHKHSLNQKFYDFILKYKLAMYRSQAYVTNLFWRTMFQAEFPDKHFREIYFSYLFGRIEDLQMMHPYNSQEAYDRKLKMMTRRYVCLPAGVENLEE